MTSPDPVSTEWRPIPGCPGYFAAADGRIASRFRRDQMMRPVAQFDRGRLDGSRSPYLSVSCVRDGKRCNRFVHELVLLAWVGPRPGSPDEWEACHGPGGSRDNRVTNLRWDTVQRNAWDRERRRDPAWEPPNAHDGDDGGGHAFSDLVGCGDA